MYEHQNYYGEKSTFEEKYAHVSVPTEKINFFNHKSDCTFTSKSLKKKLENTKNIVSDLRLIWCKKLSLNTKNMARVDIKMRIWWYKHA